MPSTPATAGVYSPRIPSTPATAGVNSPRMPSTPATAGVYSPRMPSTPATAGVNPPRQIYHICRRQMSIPPRQIYHICRRQMSTPHRHLWRGGGRQAGGEVQNPSYAQQKPKKPATRAGFDASQINYSVGVSHTALWVPRVATSKLTTSLSST